MSIVLYAQNAHITKLCCKINAQSPLMGTAEEQTIAKHSPLTHLSKRSANIGIWEIVVCAPKAESRKYIWDGKERTSHSFTCRLVSTEDPTHYVQADSHGKGVSKTIVDGLKEKYKDGLVFQMSKVAFADNVQNKDNSAPKTEVVCMRNTKFSPVLSSASKPSMPEPNIPLSASLGIQKEQLFDALALIRDMSEVLSGGTTRSGQQRQRCTITLIDGSMMDDGAKEACLLPVTVFTDASQDDNLPPLFQELQDAFNNKYAMAFFGIQGKKGEKKDDTWSFQSSFNFVCQRASNTKKGKDLESKAEHLNTVIAKAVPLTPWEGRTQDHDTSYADIDATETTCALLKTILRDSAGKPAQKTNVTEIDSQSTFWQINCCQVYLPSKGEQMYSGDGERLWFLVKIEDETGCLSLFMREKAALSLSVMDTKEEFDAAFAQDILSFPQKASVKIIRKPPDNFTTPQKNQDRQTTVMKTLSKTYDVML